MYSRRPLWSRMCDRLQGVSDDSQTLEAQVAKHIHRIKQVKMSVQNGSVLAISWLPAFQYMPEWSLSRPVTVAKVTGVDGLRLYVTFDPHSHRPSMAFNTAFLKACWPLPVPGLPPGVEVRIHTCKLEGWIDLGTGEIQIQFDSEFINSIFGFETKPMPVSAIMTTGKSEGKIFNACGQKLKNGRAKLVALSKVPKTDDWVPDHLLQLPTEALSVLKVKLDFVTMQMT